MIIEPTVGRVVLYTPAATDNQLVRHGGGPLAAIIANVWSYNCVNLAVFDANGVSFNRTSVLLIHDGQTSPEWGDYCEWMPYQKGQAAKAEALEAKLQNAHSHG
ncbi:MAG: hypothetical protein ACLP7P_08550 [Rhodomicrobium sp.]